eukprot:Nk52_evm3s179 gene=Nk52_evmTU3s179
MASVVGFRAGITRCVPLRQTFARARGSSGANPLRGSSSSGLYCCTPAPRRLECSRRVGGVRYYSSHVLGSLPGHSGSSNNNNTLESWPRPRGYSRVGGGAVRVEEEEGGEKEKRKGGKEEEEGGNPQGGVTAAAEKKEQKEEAEIVSGESDVMVKGENKEREILSSEGRNTEDKFTVSSKTLKSIPEVSYSTDALVAEGRQLLQRGLIADAFWTFDEAIKTDSNGNAMFEIGQLYEAGIGVPQDESVAVDWYWAAHDQECRKGTIKLAECYSLGKGVEQDEEMARRVLQGHVPKETEVYTFFHRSFMLVFVSGMAASVYGLFVH